MKTENYENDWDIENNPALAVEDNFYFDEPIIEKDHVEELIEQKLWLLLSQLAQVKSPLASALFYVLSGCREFQSAMADDCGVSVVRFHQLINLVMDDLAAGKQFKQIEDDEEIIFRRPKIRKKSENKKYTTKKNQS